MCGSAHSLASIKTNCTAKHKEVVVVVVVVVVVPPSFPFIYFDMGSDYL